MWLYLIIFFIPVIAYFMGPAENRNKLFLRWYCAALAAFVGFSDMFGGFDRYIYGQVFDNVADGISYNVAYSEYYMFSYFETGYSWLSWAIAWITENRYIYILIITCLIYLCIYKSFERIMPNYPLAMVLFLGMVFFFTFTYLRQVLAFSVAWLGVKYLIDRQKWKFFLVVVIVALLHKSGIIFLGLYFMPLKKWKPSAIIIIMLICATLGGSGFSSNIYDAYDSVSEEQRAFYSYTGGIRIAYFLEVAFFIWIILTNYHKIEPTRKNLIMLNMAWAFCGLLLLFIRSTNGGRIAWFFTLGIIYIVTLIGISVKTRKIIRLKNGLSQLMIVVMLLLFLRIFTSWQVYNNLYPYKTFLSDGHRSPDYSWEKYEYDHRYDEDKFYRPAFRFLK